MPAAFPGQSIRRTTISAANVIFPPPAARYFDLMIPDRPYAEILARLHELDSFLATLQVTGISCGASSQTSKRYTLLVPTVAMLL
jgi:hypothetical protein